MHKVAIVILNWNGKHLLNKYLLSIVNNTDFTSSKLYVIDNCSTDDSVSFLQNNYPEIGVVILDKNYGFAEGYNKGLVGIKSEYYVLLNSDVEVTENWLQPMISTLDNDKDIAVVQPKILAERNKDFFEYAGASGGFIDKLGFPFCRGRIFGSLEKDQGQYQSSREIFWASGACFVIRASVFWDNNGFDSYFFAHMEEIDLCWRIRNKGFTIMCLPESVVYHVGGATLDESNPYKTYLNYRNNMLMIYKNVVVEDLKAIILKRRIYNYISALKFLFSGKWKLFKAIVKADKDFRQAKGQYPREKLDIYRNTFKDKNIVYQQNIVIAYYLHKKKRFDTLDF